MVTSATSTLRAPGLRGARAPERRERVLGAPCGVQPDRVRVGVVGRPRSQLGGLRELGERFASALLPHQQEAERVMDRRVPRVHRERLAQRRGSLVVLPWSRSRSARLTQAGTNQGASAIAVS